MASLWLTYCYLKPLEMLLHFFFKLAFSMVEKRYPMFPTKNPDIIFGGSSINHCCVKFEPSEIFIWMRMQRMNSMNSS